ncbi:ABC transporter permease [Paenibacillus favisporus]|uniref:ABC transporter permease n=1 Tax=Paenibacillus favisporus TaxID=221028 RepID=UPI003D2DC900
MRLISFKNIYKQHKFIWQLSKKDLQSRYLGSFLGVLWAFIQPAVQIVIFWFVFQVGFKSVPVDNFPFILWLVSAMIPWFYVSDSVLNGTNSILENSYLVKKVVFKVGLLPIVKIYSALCVHGFFLITMLVMFGIYGYYPNLYNIQILYYLLGSTLLILGISWVTSALVIFLKDVGQFISILLQFGFWLTPIFYSINIIPSKFQTLMKLNPFFYIIEGYRDSLIYRKWFWEHPLLTVYFWTATLLMIVAGIFIFRKLRPHFADVL